MSMNIDDVKKRRDTLAETIKAELAKFQRETGVAVSNVNAAAQRSPEDKSAWPGQVRIHLRIADE